MLSTRNASMLMMSSSVYLLSNLIDFKSREVNCLKECALALSNSAGTFKRVMEVALSGLQWVTCLIYIDNIVCFCKTFNEHVERVSEILSRIQKAGMKLKPQKCNLFQDEVTFIGYVFNKDGVKPNQDNIAKIIQWPVPK